MARFGCSEVDGDDVRLLSVGCRPACCGWTVAAVPSGSAILVDPGGRTSLPGDGGPMLGPNVREYDLVLGVAVPPGCYWWSRWPP